MEIDPVLIIVVGGSVGALLIERVFYYRVKYGERKKKKDDCCPDGYVKPENPSHGERLVGLETDVENLRNDNNKDHKLIRKSIDTLTTRINGVLRK